MPTIFISAGEASGDHYGAGLMRAMRKKTELHFYFFGLGGLEMRAEGLDAGVKTEQVAHMGITEVLLHAPKIWTALQSLKKWLRYERPELVILIDFPDVNFRLAKEAKRLGIPVLWLVSPQLWAWKKRRLRWVQQRVTKMLAIFPFEETFYRERGVDAEFIGHPLADLPMPEILREEFAAKHGLDAAKPWVALLPGSRVRELKLNMPEMLRAARRLGKNYEYILPVAATLPHGLVPQEVRASSPDHSVRISLVDDARAALFHARASVVASGTATVQAALMGNPFVIVYRMSGLSYSLARRFVSVKFAGMPNLIAGKEIVPELLQSDFTALNVVTKLLPLLQDGPEREQQRRALVSVRQQLGAAAELQNASTQAHNGNTASAMERAAGAAMDLLTR